MAPLVRHQPLDPAKLRAGVSLGTAEAAKRLGISRRALQRYESRERVPDATLLGKMAVLYGLADDQIGALSRHWPGVAPLTDGSAP